MVPPAASSAVSDISAAQAAIRAAIASDNPTEVQAEVDRMYQSAQALQREFATMVRRAEEFENRANIAEHRLDDMGSANSNEGMTNAPSRMPHCTPLSKQRGVDKIPVLKDRDGFSTFAKKFLSFRQDEKGLAALLKMTIKEFPEAEIDNDIIERNLETKESMSSIPIDDLNAEMHALL